MSDEFDESRVRATFDRLRIEATKVDTMAALRTTKEHGRRVSGLAMSLAGAAMAGILVIVGFAVWSGGDDRAEQVSTGDPIDGSESQESLGGSWVLVSGTGPDGPVPLVAGWPVTISFDGDSLGGTAACNSYGGFYTLSGDVLSIEEIAQTEMGCDGAVMSSEQSFLGALAVVDRLAIVSDQLVLSGPSAELTFDREQPVPVAELVGQLWLLDTLIQGEAASTVQGDPATLLLREDGTLEGSTGCRTLTGEYLITGATVQFTSFAADGECSPDLTDQDNLVVTVLGDGFNVEIESDRMTLTSQGNEGLGYRAIADEPGGDEAPSGSSFADIACQETSGAVGTDIGEHVRSITSFESADCRRTVFEIGGAIGGEALTGISTGDFAPFIGALTGTSISVPSGCEGAELAAGEPCPAPGFGIDIDVELLDTSVGVAALAQTRDGTLYLYVDHGGDDTTVSFWPSPARIIVDTRIEGGAAPVPVLGEVVLSRPIPPMLEGLPVTVQGLARPFEAQGSVSLRQAPQIGAAPGSGEPVSATWSGFELLGDGHVGSTYGYRTASTDTWGDFAIAIDDLPVGNYELLFEAFAAEESGSAGTYVTFSVL